MLKYPLGRGGGWGGGGGGGGGAVVSIRMICIFLVVLKQ